MRLIVGLGNPDKKYLQTRHNIGFMVLDKIADTYHVSFKVETKFQSQIATFDYQGQKVLLVKPQTYMNLSGLAVAKVMSFYQIDIKDLLVISDDISLAPGALRLRATGGHGGHNGLRNIIDQLSSQAFKRLRLGIGENKNIPLEHYVLSNFSKAEQLLIDESIHTATQAIEAFSFICFKCQ